MAKDKKNVYTGTGHRKTSVARVTLTSGTLTGAAFAGRTTAFHPCIKASNLGFIVNRFSFKESIPSGS